MNRNYKISGIATGVIVLVFVGGFIFLGRDGEENTTNLVFDIKDGGVLETKEVQNPEPVVVEQKAFKETYNSSKYGFSFNYPTGYTETSFQSAQPDGSLSETIIVQDAKNLQGFQIVISEFDEDIDMTEARIKADIPSLAITNPQEVTLGPTRKGLAFLSDNDAYGGASREVWFVFRGNLYQISTYASLDSLLQQVLNTWQFN